MILNELANVSLVTTPEEAAIGVAQAMRLHGMTPHILDIGLLVVSNCKTDGNADNDRAPHTLCGAFFDRMFPGLPKPFQLVHLVP